MFKKIIYVLIAMSVFSCGLKEDEVYEYSGSRSPYTEIPTPEFVTEDLYSYSYGDFGHTYNIVENPEGKVGSSKDLIANIDSLKPLSTKLDSIIDLLGFPTSVVIAQVEDVYFLNVFYDEVQLYFSYENDILVEIRFHEETEYKYKNEITYGTTLEKLLEVLPAVEVDDSGVIDWDKSDVLYTNLEDGVKYISYSQERVRVFIKDDKVSGLYLF